MAVILKRAEQAGERFRGKARRPYTVRWTANGKQREKSFATMREAKDYKIKVEHDTRAHIFTDPDMKTAVSAYFQTWLATHPVGEGSKRTYRSVFRQQIEPALGDKPLGKVTREDIRSLLLDGGLADHPAAQRTARTMLTAMFGEALKSGRVTLNPAQGIRLPAERAPRAEFYMASREELERLAKELGEPWGLSVWLMRGCGLRPGEALGLRHEDIRGDTLRVTRQRLQDGSTGPCKARRHGQYRDVPLPGYLAEMIPAGSGDVFPPSRTDVYRDRFMRAAKAAGLPEGFHPHMLRHAYASALLAAGVPLFEVSRYLGHRSADFTAAVYGHLVPSAPQRARDALDAEYAAWT